MNILIAGGGTGGHLFPALAVAKSLIAISPDAHITFAGTARGIEARIVPKEGFDIRFIRSEGLVGKSIIKTAHSLLKLPLSFTDSYSILNELRPDLVIGVGGYSAGPVTMCAKMMGIPTMIHEQNIFPGLTNRILGKFVDTVAVSYHESIKYFPEGRTYLTGNPVRHEIVKGSRDRGMEIFSLAKDRFTIFVFGGSLGASSINKAVGEALTFLQPYRDRIQFLHQTGEKECSSMKEVYRASEFMGTVVPFAYEMADAYAVSDLVISRAGATTLSELTACGKAAILMPYPHAAANHQEINARKLWDLGAAQMLLDEELDGHSLAEMITQLIEDPDAIGMMERTSKSIGSTEASNKVVQLAMGLLKKKVRDQNYGIKAAAVPFED
ncbi:MAG: undecaprenyldiphospho-muramoylpentapeptide beta-N-acetylglucosaminyltransferase [Nitrospira sp.]|nr:undecaprenyldiphospho-muramoylpentapeptide beta-N-acetylglucosaminyltransferase [bacterium]MBL7048196.1 undecaprenyldiphospho-muramoylpentapeptide beta-N-acetylglucosaminyltransferase [Nitrospira sp.]